MPTRWLPFFLALTIACAGPRSEHVAAPASPPGPAPAGPAGPGASGAAGVAPPTTPATGAVVVSRGMTPDEVRRAAGAPARTESVPSSTAAGARYERWTYPGREVVFLDGKVVDVVSW